MNKWTSSPFAPILFTLILSSPTLAQAITSANSPGIDFETIVVKYKKGHPEGHIRANLTSKKNRITSINNSLGFAVIACEDGAKEDAIESYRELPFVEYAEPIIEFTMLFSPNDPYYSSHQYGPQIIDIEEAWDITRGDSSTIVAVVDTGVQDDHEDLLGQVVQGYDFIDDDSNPEDEEGHGTHVAGTIAALIDNGLGIAGIAPDVKIMAVRVLDASGSGTNASVANGIVYAADSGAKVINLGFSSSHHSSIVQDAVEYAWNKGVVVVAAVGGSGNTRRSYPAYYQDTISVAATDSNDEKASFSTYGPWVDVAAPGVSIISTKLNGGYVEKSGTSMASAFVTGVAALLASKGLSNSEIRSAIEDTADYISGTGCYWKHGRINAYSALTWTDKQAPDTELISLDDRKGVAEYKP